jgi:hypothetical protein
MLDSSTQSLCSETASVTHVYGNTQKIVELKSGDGRHTKDREEGFFC